MEWASKAVNAAVKAAEKASNNEKVVNSFLGACFLALCLRSSTQQTHIEALESQKESLAKANKAMKTTLWDWKQQLYAEASTDSPLVPLAALKSIYGDTSSHQTGKVKNAEARLSGKEILV